VANKYWLGRSQRRERRRSPRVYLSKAANTRVFIVYNDRENPLFSSVLTFEQKFYILVCIVVYEVLRLVREQGLYAGPRNPNV
jgi:hypothetical protein